MHPLKAIRIVWRLERTKLRQDVFDDIAKVERSMRQLQNNPTKISAFYQKPTLQYAA